MSDNFAIRVKNLSKIYKLYNNPIDRLKESLHPFRHKYHRPFYALRDLNFGIKSGEAVGIVGKNGAGKSTLLQIIAGVLSPSSGRIDVNGNISALLELGSGFNPEATGIDNVFFNGSILGYSRDEIKSKLDEIVSFADIGDFLYQPIKNYSSGMKVRLAFSVATLMNPDILIVDEALAVGDEAFQRKCFARIMKLKEDGSTILFVTHSAGIIVELCDWALLMDSGEVLLSGAPKDVVAEYHKLIYASKDKMPILRDKLKSGRRIEESDIQTENNKNDVNRSEIIKPETPDLFDPNLVPKSTICYESRGAIVKNPRIININGEKVNILVSGREYTYCYDVMFTEHAFKVRFGSMLKTITGFHLGGLVSHPEGEGIDYIKKGAKVTQKFKIRIALTPGTYFLNCGVVALIDGEEIYLHRLIDAIMFKVQPEENIPFTGFVNLSSGIPEMDMLMES